MYTDNPARFSLSGVLESHYSDHKIVFGVLNGIESS